MLNTAILSFVMRRSGVRFISPAPVDIRPRCYQLHSIGASFISDVTADVIKFVRCFGFLRKRDNLRKRRKSNLLVAPITHHTSAQVSHPIPVSRAVPLFGHRVFLAGISDFLRVSKFQRQGSRNGFCRHPLLNSLQVSGVKSLFLAK